jgi:hypothetical protein
MIAPKRPRGLWQRGRELVGVQAALEKGEWEIE